MRRKYMMICCLCLSLTACSSRKAKDNIKTESIDFTISSQIETSGNTLSDTNDSRNSLKLNKKIKQTQIADNVFDISEDFSKDSMQVTNIYTISSSKYLIQYKKDGDYYVMIWSLNENTFSDSINCGPTDIYVTPNGFYYAIDAGLSMQSIGETEGYIDNNTSNTNITLFVYDTNCNEIYKGEAGFNIRNKSFCLSDDLKTIYYSKGHFENGISYLCIYSANLDMSDEKILYKTNITEKDYGICGISDMNYCGDYLNFDCSVFPKADGSVSSISGYGTFSLKNFEIDYSYRTDGYYYDNRNGFSGSVFYDGGYPYGVQSSGEVVVMRNGMSKILSLSTLNESSNAYISQYCAYICTVLGGTTEDSLPLFRFSIYDTKTGEQIRQFDYTGVENDEIASLTIDEENYLIVAVISDKVNTSKMIAMHF